MLGLTSHKHNGTNKKQQYLLSSSALWWAQISSQHQVTLERWRLLTFWLNSLYGILTILTMYWSSLSFVILKLLPMFCCTVQRIHYFNQGIHQEPRASAFSPRKMQNAFLQQMSHQEWDQGTFPTYIHLAWAVWVTGIFRSLTLSYGSIPNWRERRRILIKTFTRGQNEQNGQERCSVRVIFFFPAHGH